MIGGLNLSFGGGRRWFKGSVTSAAMSALLVVAPVAGSAESDPLSVLKATTDELMAEVESKRTEIEADPTVARDVVKRILSPHLDLDRTSRWVLGKHWRAADDGQKERFIVEFRTLLVRTYATAVAELVGVDIEYLPLEEEVDAKDVTVQTQIPQDGGPPIGVYYRMYKSDAGWKVYDVSIDGVSLVTTYRSSFSRVVRKDGIDGLIDRLAEKNRGSGKSS